MDFDLRTGAGLRCVRRQRRHGVLRSQRAFGRVIGIPFEGAGAISRWRIDLPQDCNAFDFDTLADVIVRLSYTARDGGAPLAATARASLAIRRAISDSSTGIAPPLQRMLRVRYEFSDAWIAFRNDAAKGA